MAHCAQDVRQTLTSPKYCGYAMMGSHSQFVFSVIENLAMCRHPVQKKVAWGVVPQMLIL
ncbi:hypothetical protein ACVW1C_002561 [Bradyrhizobium sp. USDA 4011]